MECKQRRQCLCLFATHYFELTELAQEPAIDNYHVTAKELNGNLILLHKVKHGPASQSHGLQVAKLAGIPHNVIIDAQKRLQQLELQQQKHRTVLPQADLFDATPIAHEIERVVEIVKPSATLETLAAIDVDDLSPRQALEQLYALKKLLKAE